VPLDEDGNQAHGALDAGWLADEADDVSRGLERDDARRVVNQALDRLPLEFREIIVLRELEDLSYQEIARIAHIPLGTVMSRLSRARKLLFAALQHDPQEP
jgi:RNA polymerase sigma-70 factor (ECF subfamily)